MYMNNKWRMKTEGSGQMKWEGVMVACGNEREGQNKFNVVKINWLQLGMSFLTRPTPIRSACLDPYGFSPPRLLDGEGIGQKNIPRIRGEVGMSLFLVLPRYPPQN